MLYLCLSRSQHRSGCGPSVTVHRGRPLTAPGEGALHHGLTLHTCCGVAAPPLSHAATPVPTISNVLTEIRWGSLGGGLPQGQGLEQTPRRVVPQSAHARHLILITVPTGCDGAAPGGARTRGGGGSRAVLWGGLNRRRGRRQRRGGRGRYRWRGSG